MKRIVLLLILALLAYAAGALLLVRANPEAAFWCDLRARQDAELEAIRRENPGRPVLIFTGGSSTAFSVDPAVVAAESGLPAVNLGTGAWSGPKYYVHRSLQRARAGDVLVLGIEPNFLVEAGLLEPSQLGLAMAWREGDPDAADGGGSFGGGISWRERAGLLRPGARYLVTWAAKAVAGGERYHYTLADLRDGGRLETARPHPTGAGDPVIHPAELTAEAREFLGQIAAAARERGVRVVYALPWYFTAPESAAANREARRHLLEQIAGILPVLDDPALGVRTEPDLFSDTHFHLTARGSAERSRRLGRALRE
jgi:hypothetical protein